PRRAVDAGIRVGAPGEEVDPVGALEIVVAGFPVEAIVPGPAVQAVVAASSEHGVVAGVAEDEVVPRPAGDAVVAIVSDEPGIDVGTGVQGVAELAAVD